MYAEEKLCLFVSQACFGFFSSGQVSLSPSYLTVFDASQKLNSSVMRGVGGGVSV